MSKDSRKSPSDRRRRKGRWREPKGVVILPTLPSSVDSQTKQTLLVSLLVVCVIYVCRYVGDRVLKLRDDTSSAMSPSRGLSGLNKVGTLPRFGVKGLDHSPTLPMYVRTLLLESRLCPVSLKQSIL